MIKIKKLLPVFICIITALALTACSSDGNNPGSGSSATPTKQIHIIKSQTDFDKNDKITFKRVYDYNIFGNNTVITDYIGGDENKSEATSYEYNKQNICISETFHRNYDNESNKYTLTNYEINSSGLRGAATVYAADEKTEPKIKYNIKYEYNNGVLKSETATDKNGKSVYKTTCSFNADNKLSESVTVYPKYTETTSYKYNSDGLVASETFVSNKKDAENYTIVYEYTNIAGSPVVSTASKLDGDGNNLYTDKYEYNNSGDKIKTTRTDKNGGVISYTVYEWTDLDNIVA